MKLLQNISSVSQTDDETININQITKKRSKKTNSKFGEYELECDSSDCENLPSAPTDPRREIYDPKSAHVLADPNNNSKLTPLNKRQLYNTNNILQEALSQPPIIIDTVTMSSDSLESTCTGCKKWEGKFL